MNCTGFRLPFSILLILLTLSASAAFAGPIENSLFQDANEAYSRGDYDQAISKYEQITTTSGYSPSVLYNLANSYALSGNTGRAILNYERALRLSPSDSDISGNLELVKKENGLFSKELSTVERLFLLLNLDQWTVLGLFSLLLVTTFLIATMKYRLSRQLVIGVSISCFLLICLATAGTVFSYQSFNPSVVVSPDVKLLISPFESSTSIGGLQEGRLVYPQKKHGDFSYVTDETDRKGWIPTSMIESVCQTAGLRSR